MASVSGYWGSASNYTGLVNPVDMHCSLPANKYPKGTLSLNVTWGRIGTSQTKRIWVYLCDANGNNDYSIGVINLSQATSTGYNTYSVNCPNLRGKSLYIKAEGDTDNIKTYGRVTFTLDVADYSFPITVTSQTGGSCTSSHENATPGTTIKLTPTANTGYKHTGYTSSQVTVSNNKFTMPGSAVAVQANFAKQDYTLTGAVSPAAAGVVTLSTETANAGDTITISQTPNEGYYFIGWSSVPEVTIQSGQFTMPASNVTITANYLHRSTATLSKDSMQGGDTVVMTILSESLFYTHKYQLSFGTGMETVETVVPAGDSNVTISIPENWTDQIPNAVKKEQGTLTLKTYSGTTLIGTFTLGALTYNVPASVVPTLTDPVAAIVRTIDGTTYANVGDYYVQNHCGVRVTDSATGVRSSTIADIRIQIDGYVGNKYNSTQTGASLDFTSGILTIAGETTIRVTATDSRGRTATKATTITVIPYGNPTGKLTVRRVDYNGDDDENGNYGKYVISDTQYTQIGTNSLSLTLGALSDTASNPAASGDLLPGDRKYFDNQQEYEITLTLTDAFETTIIREKLYSGRFIIWVSQDGTRMAFMKASVHSVPTGKASVLEFPDTMQIYIGNETLEDYIARIAAGN